MNPISKYLNVRLLTVKITAMCVCVDYWGGWACFTASIVMIGVLTAFIGDLASSFGCTIGLKDAITAISFVALGTSVPGRCTEYLNKS